MLTRTNGEVFWGSMDFSRVVDNMEEKEVRSMDLRFLNLIMRFFLVGGVGMSISMVIARWSKMVR